MTPSPTHWSFRPTRGRRSGRWPRIVAEDLATVRDPLQWKLDLGRQAPVDAVIPLLVAAARGPVAAGWDCPAWLFRHQSDAARRLAGALRVFGGALLADAVGLGKTFVSLAIATRYGSTTVVSPSVLRPQWLRAARRVGVRIRMVTHESLSRGTEVPRSDLIVVDEAHRFRNPGTRRYDRLARGLGAADALLVTATPVVNRIGDVGHLLRLVLPDHALRMTGILSIEAAVERGRAAPLVRAAAPLVVARSGACLDGVAGRVPRPMDGDVRRDPPVSPTRLETLLAAVDALEFPVLGDSDGPQLLRLHLLHRLASSVPAARETLRRHLAYLDRAMAAASRGESLPRGASRVLFGPGDDLQLAFEALSRIGPQHIDRGRFEQERARLLVLLGKLAAVGSHDPKAARLCAMLEQRGEAKTVVFTGAIATALALARRRRWHRTAVVGGGRAWIASGRVPVADVLGLFAPRAQHASAPPPTTTIATLICTDLVSEGLDLQDADMVVHYDLPWTPLRLAQRVGRIVRLGSRHPVARILWFAPPRALDRRLRLTMRLRDKRRCQLALGVSATSAVGRARVLGGALAYRERIIALAGAVAGATGTTPTHAVVRGPSAVVAAVVWRWGEREVPELLALAGVPPTELDDLEHVHRLFASLQRAPATPRRPPAELLRCLSDLVRRRLGYMPLGATDGTTRSLARAILRRAAEAGRARRLSELTMLDAVLGHTTGGLRVGAQRTLTDLVGSRCTTDRLASWLRGLPAPHPAGGDLRLIGALFGDGTR